MPTVTYTPITSQTLGTATATVNFTSIPQIYRDLVLVVNASPTTGTLGLRFRVNNDNTAKYFTEYMLGNGTSASGNGFSAATEMIDLNTGLSGSYQQITNFLDYSVVDKTKVILSRVDAPSTATSFSVHRWAETVTAISTINVYTSTNTFAVGSTFSLYGVIA